MIGFDAGRLAMIMAVLEARCGLNFAGMDVYLSVAGGYRITEPAGDLAAAAALLSSLAGNAVPSRSVFFGEIALSGAVRAAPRMDQRLKEAARLGFQRAYGPDSSPAAEGALTVTPIARLIALVDLLAPDAANA